MDPMDSLGLHLKASGDVYACSADVIWRHGTVPMSPDGRPSFSDLRSLMQTLGIPAFRRFCISCDLPDYPALSSLLASTGGRWLHPTRAMALARMEQLLVDSYEGGYPMEDLHYLALYEEAGRITIAAFDFLDGIIDTLETHTVVRESFERTADALERLIRIPDLWDKEHAWEVDCVFEESGLMQCVRDTFRHIQGDPKTHATFGPIRSLDMDVVVQGASVQTMILNALRANMLLLDALPATIRLCVKDRPAVEVSRFTTIPTSKTDAIALRDERMVLLVVDDFEHHGALRSHRLELDPQLVERMAHQGELVHFTIDIDARFRIRISCTCGDVEIRSIDPWGA